MAATTISRTALNALVDDDGSELVGSFWNKAAIGSVIMDAIDALFASAFTFGSTVAAAAGSVSAAAYRADGDPNTGIYFPAADQLAIAAAGVQRMFFGAAGLVAIGDDANAKMTVGLTINQGANDDEAIALKSSDVAHDMTDLAEADTYGVLKKLSATFGGVELIGYTESVETTAVRIRGIAGVANATRSTAGEGPIYLDAQVRSGTTSADLAADKNMVLVRNGTTVRFILDSDGDSHQDVGTAWTNFDDHEDLELLHALSAGVSRKRDPLRRQFARFLERHRRTLERAGLVTFNDDGHHFVNWSRTHMLTIGAVRQTGMRQAALVRVLAEHDSRLKKALKAQRLLPRAA